MDRGKWNQKKGGGKKKSESFRVKRKFKRVLFRHVLKEVKRRLKTEKEQLTIVASCGGMEPDDIPEPYDDVELLDGEIENKELRVGIMFEDQRFRMTKKYAYMLSGMLESKNILRDEFPGYPDVSILKMGAVSSGEFLIIPAEDHTQHWLLNCWPPPFLDGRKTLVFPASQMKYTLPTYRVFFRVADTNLIADMNDFSTQLAERNKKMDCPSWKFVSKIPLPSYTILIYDISPESRSALVKANWTINVDKSPVEVKYYSPKNFKEIFKS